MGVVWPPRAALRSFEPPTEMGQLGIHAYSYPQAAIEWLAYIQKTRKVLNDASIPVWTHTYAMLAGSVKLWGVVQVHEDGYRAEFAYPQELWVPHDFDPVTILELERSYGVHVRWLTDDEVRWTEGL